MAQRHFALHHRRIDIDFTHIIHNHGNLFALPVIENMAKNGGFTCTEKPRKNRYRKLFHQ